MVFVSRTREILASAFGCASKDKDDVKIIACPAGELFSREKQDIIAKMIMRAGKEVMFRIDIRPEVKTE